MYLRKTSRKNKDGSSVEYLQLAHNERNPQTGKPVAKIIHNFGRADLVDRDQLVRLCRSIARVCELTVIDPLDGHHGRQFASAVGLPKELKLKRTVSLGCALAAEKLWETVCLKNTIADIVRKNKLRAPYERALFAMVANRLCRPESKLGLWDRWLSTVYLPDCQDLELKQMYEAMDFLHEHSEEIEKAVFFYTANLFNLSVDLVFYDTTTAAFSIDREDDDDTCEQPLRRFGHSKDGTWSPQVVVALAVTQEGIPVRIWVFPGNTSDFTTVEKVRNDLRGWQLGRAMFVTDSGMNSEENRIELARACGKYLLACRMASVAEIKQKVLSKRGRYVAIKDNLLAKEVIVGDGERRKRYILCYNPKEAKRQGKHRHQLVEFLEQELARHKNDKATAQWAIELLASKRFKRYLRITKAGRIRIDRGKINEAAKYDGK